MTKLCKMLCLALMIIMTAAIGTTGCKWFSSQAAVSGDDKLQVVASTYPVYEFTRQVAGDKANLTLLVAPGSEPHDWEPTAKDLAQIRKAKVFLYHGAGFEPWVGKVAAKEALGGAVPVEISKNIPLLTGMNQDDPGHSRHGENGHVRGGAPDPHIWLDPVLAQQEVNNIAAALAAVDPKNAEFYQQNAANYNAELRKLDQEFGEVLSRVKKREIITSHAAFAYLAKRYGLREVPVMGLSPHAEPTPDRIADIVKFCREHDVKYIFFETLLSPKLAQTIARETGAAVLVLNPLEGLSEEEMRQSKDYLSVMRENLKNLQTALSQ